MLKAVYFDLDRTLYDRDTSFRQFLASQHAKFAHALGSIPLETYVAKIEEWDNRGRVWKDTVYQTVVQEFKVEGVAWEVLFEDFITRFTDYCIPFPGLLAALAQLKADGFQLGLISNGFEEFQFRIIRALGIQHRFEVIVISEMEGMRKPDPEIFRRALARLDVLARESVYVGAHPVIDIGGARDAGMKTVWKNNGGQIEGVDADAVIAQLDELPAVLANLQASAAV